MRSTPAVRYALSLCLVLCALSCREDSPVELTPPVEVVRAVWDPSGGVLPTPTDLARDATTGRLALPVDDTLPQAEQQWRGWLNTLDGYPISSTLTLPVDGPVEESGLGSAVVLVDARGGSRVSVRGRYDAATSSMRAEPIDDTGERRQLERGTTYHYGVWGYEGGASGAAGEPLVADRAFYFVRQPHSLLDHARALPGDSLHAQQEAAEALEALRKNYAPIVTQMERLGVPREELAVLGSFTTSARHSIWFDAASAQVPLPNNALLDRQTQRVALPPSESDDEEARHLKEVLSTYDGFSTTGAITLRATTALDPATALDPGAVRVFRVEADGTLFEHTDLERQLLEDQQTVWVRPRLAFEPATTYLYVVSDVLRAQEGGARLEAPPLGAMLRLSAPLVDAEGASQLGALSDDEAARLEPTRAESDAALAVLASQLGLERRELALAVPFRTLDPAKFLMGWRARLTERQVRTDVVDVLARAPSDRGLRLLLPSVRTIVTGKLTTLDTLDRRTLRMREDGALEERLIDFTLVIPKSARAGEPIPTVVFGHGLLTSRELLYLIAERLAEEGYASISVDLPLHGERSVCLRDVNCLGDGARCDLTQRVCVKADGTPGGLRRVSSPVVDGPTYPVTSGEPFIDLDDIEGSRDHFIQAVIDISQLVRVVRGADWAKASGGYLLDGQDVVYLGMSLGGILGAVMTVVEPSIESYVLNVPGGGLFEMVENSAAFSSLYDQALEKRGIMARRGEAYVRFQGAIRWMLDMVDPINLVQHAVQRPLRYIDPVDGEERVLPTKRVMIQMAENDSVVPNITTELLSARMGVDYRRYTPTISNHAFLFDPTSGEGRRARQDMITFYEGRAR